MKIIIGTRKLFRNTNTLCTDTIIYDKSSTITYSNFFPIIQSWLQSETNPTNDWK